jgi:hypothetical protein
MLNATAREIKANVKSIRAVPRALLPDGPARDELVRRAQAGEDVYCYHAGLGPDYTWNIWLVNERIEAHDYVERFTSR